MKKQAYWQVGDIIGMIQNNNNKEEEMKTAEEILNEVLVDVENRPVFFREQDVADLIGQAQKEAYNAGKEQLKREAITIISEDELVSEHETLDSYREKLKIIIDVL